MAKLLNILTLHILTKRRARCGLRGSCDGSWHKSRTYRLQRLCQLCWLGQFSRLIRTIFRKKVVYLIFWS